MARSVERYIRAEHRAELLHELTATAAALGRLQAALPPAAFARVRERMDTREIVTIGHGAYDLVHPRARLEYVERLEANLASYREIVIHADRWSLAHGAPTDATTARVDVWWFADNEPQHARQVLAIDVLEHLSTQHGWNTDDRGTWMHPDRGARDERTLYYQIPTARYHNAPGAYSTRRVLRFDYVTKYGAEHWVPEWRDCTPEDVPASWSPTPTETGYYNRYMPSQGG